MRFVHRCFSRCSSFLSVAIGLTLIAHAPLAISDVTASQESSARQRCDAWLVATAPLPLGSPMTANEIILSQPDGAFAMTIPFNESSSVTPAAIEDRALARSLDSRYAVLNAADQTATMLKFAGSEPGAVRESNFLYPDTRGHRYQLMGNPAHLATYVIDMHFGETVALADLLPESDLIVTAAVSPNDRWLTFSTGRQSYLVDLLAIDQAEPLEPQRETRSASFTDDGQSLVFLRETDTPSTELVIRDLESNEDRILLASAEWIGARVFPGDAIVAFADGRIVRATLDIPEGVTLLAGGGELFPMTVDLETSSLLIRQEQRDVNAWHLVRLDGQGAVELPELTGMSMVSPSTQLGWALFANDLAPTQGVPGQPYHALDLATGAVAIPLVQDGDGLYVTAFPATDDGRYHLVQAISTAQGRVWLLDLATGRSTLVGSSPGNVYGVLTPDGCFLALGKFDALGEGRQGVVQIIDLKTGQSVADLTDMVVLGWLMAMDRE